MRRYIGAALNPKRYDPDPTEEQEHILSIARDTTSNIMMKALAGTGKTSTLEMIEGVVDTKPILYMVFNKRNADEAEKRMQSTTTVRTFNSMGHRTWAKAIAPRVTVDPKKMDILYKSMIDEVKSKETRDLMWEVKWEVLNACARAKALGYVPDDGYPHAKRLLTATEFHRSLEERPDDLLIGLIDSLLLLSIQTAYKGNIDYNDQIYMPTLFGGPFPRFPLVKVDEYQDLNPVNHAMLDRLVTARIIGVGDPWQNIYAFRGAKHGGMAAATEKFKMIECDLSVSFRCPQAVVEAARWRVPHFKWTKPGGHVEKLDRLPATDITDNSVILCRNNAPLLALAFKLLSAGRSVHVQGSDIGPKIVAIMRKLGDGNASREQTLGLIEDWREEKLTRSSTTANDIADCMRVFANFGRTLSEAITYAEHLFAQKGRIRLMTGHKSKGLEFDKVIMIDTYLLDEGEQDLNLRYVMQTRSSNELYEVESANIDFGE